MKRKLSGMVMEMRSGEKVVTFPLEDILDILKRDSEGYRRALTTIEELSKELEKYQGGKPGRVRSGSWTDRIQQLEGWPNVTWGKAKEVLNPSKKEFGAFHKAWIRERKKTRTGSVH